MNAMVLIAAMSALVNGAKTSNRFALNMVPMGQTVILDTRASRSHILCLATCNSFALCEGARFNASSRNCELVSVDFARNTPTAPVGFVLLLKGYPSNGLCFLLLHSQSFAHSVF